MPFESKVPSPASRALLGTVSGSCAGLGKALPPSRGIIRQGPSDLAGFNYKPNLVVYLALPLDPDFH